MFLNEALIPQLETPCLVIDVDKARQNIGTMQTVANRCGCALRPHIKTHKMPYFAHMQLAAGAVGITCAKVTEAEVMADGGIEDIFIAYPMVGAFRIRRAIALARRISRLILAVDSLEGATLLSNAAQKAQLRLEVRLEVDTGAARTGAQGNIPALAKAISLLPGLALTGIYTFKSLVLHGSPTTNTAAAAREEGEMMAALAAEIRAAGVDIKDISAGSSPTGALVAETGMVTEIRPGTYIFNDYMLQIEGACQPQDIAGRLYVTVVSTPSPEYAVIDGGTKTFPMDIPLDAPPYHYPGYAIVAGQPTLQLRRMNEEHGMLTSTTGETGLQVGQVLELVPIHICTALNLQNQIYLLENGTLRTQKVDARGMLV